MGGVASGEDGGGVIVVVVGVLAGGEGEGVGEADAEQDGKEALPVLHDVSVSYGFPIPAPGRTGIWGNALSKFRTVKFVLASRRRSDAKKCAKSSQDGSLILTSTVMTVMTYECILCSDNISIHICAARRDVPVFQLSNSFFHVNKHFVPKINLQFYFENILYGLTEKPIFFKLFPRTRVFCGIYF